MTKLSLGKHKVNKLIITHLNYNQNIKQSTDVDNITVIPEERSLSTIRNDRKTD